MEFYNLQLKVPPFSKCNTMVQKSVCWSSHWKHLFRNGTLPHKRRNDLENSHPLSKLFTSLFVYHCKEELLKQKSSLASCSVHTAVECAYFLSCFWIRSKQAGSKQTYSNLTSWMLLVYVYTGWHTLYLEFWRSTWAPPFYFLEPLDPVLQYLHQVSNWDHNSQNGTAIARMYNEDVSKEMSLYGKERNTERTEFVGL